MAFPALQRLQDSVTPRSTFLIGATLLLVLAIELGRRSGTVVPIPFILLYAIVVAAGGAGGRLAGGLSGTIAAAHVIYAAIIGFGPHTLTGGPVQVLLGVTLYVGTGLLLGRVRTQRDQFLKDILRHRAELESAVLARTAELRKSEEALKYSEEIFRQMAENISEVFWMTDPGENTFLYVSPAYEQIWQRSRQSLYENPRSFVDAIHPEDRDRVVAAFANQVRGCYDEEYRILRPDGSTRVIRHRAFPINNRDGAVYRVVGIAADVTEDRRRDAQLCQALKMEAIGHLTGGVTHDFNNLLSVIQSNSELLQDRLGPEEKRLDACQRAALRGSELTQRLLAYSRRQAPVPQAIDLGSLVSEMSELLTRTLGEAVDVKALVAPDLWTARADPGQVENSLLNLAVNARDAMPQGGRLTIECQNAQVDEIHVTENPDAEAGDYVVLAISDNGTGMPADVRARVFEPFFTTKEVGQGSGLGLSMVYGFAKQSGGFIAIHSEENRGTTVKLYLPRAAAAARSEPADERGATPMGRGEVVLVVENDPNVRDMAVRMVEGLGYRAIEASNAATALRLLAQGTQVDLALRDMVLPGGMCGLEFAAAAHRTQPDLPIVFMSGYSPDVAARNGPMKAEGILLNKPFRRQRLAQALQEALDRGSAR